ncbi:DUF2789 domain-containing protein [Roseateles sp.]|jgi:hypothetical protein|uniref:DUF2789 domain-containing protein n=1 Tax=Roseateles sp. TaxID=1971397 RepID=UPI003BA8EBF8
MDTATSHDMTELFCQLGLPDSPEDIKRFIAEHKPVPNELSLPDAPFWTPSQQAFLREQWRADDGDWTLLVDQLNAALREHPAPEDL